MPTNALSHHARLLLEIAALPANLLRRLDGADLSLRLIAVLRYLAPLGQGR